MNARQAALIVLNPDAHGGKGARRFETVAPAVAPTFDTAFAIVHPDRAWVGAVRSALGRGTRIFIAAGGDGTVHAVLNALVDAPGRPPLACITLGAIGLGSSNDFHKPVSARICGVPVRLDVAQAAPRDIVRAYCVNERESRSACFLVSASLGVTACANARFGEDTLLARALRRASTPLAITWAAARTVATWHDLSAKLRIDGGASEHVTLCSLNLLKTEWLSGRLHFGHAVGPASGDFDVALAAGGGRARLAADIFALLRGRFDGRPGHRRLRARSLDVRLQREASLELDGEIDLVRAVHFDMHPERIRVCA